MSEQIGNAGKPRFLAFIIDNLFATILSFLVVALLQPGNNVIGGSTVCVVYLLYYFVFEALWSHTPGKYFQGLEIRKRDGSKCSTAAAAIRTLARIFEVNPLLVGGLPAGIAILSTKRKQRVGDMIADTLVVSKTS